MLEYLTYYESRQRVVSLVSTQLKKYSEPYDAGGYNARPITSDLITDIYLEFNNRTRQPESQEYCRTRTGMGIFSQRL